jgi:hypothetical protein
VAAAAVGGLFLRTNTAAARGQLEADPASEPA